MLRRLPHPGRGFTQGLIVAGGTVWESTGGYGQSSLRRYELGAQRPDGQAPLPPELFGEGICRAGAHIWQLTWQERVALRWDARSLKLAGTIPFDRHGWGICAAGGLIPSRDGPPSPHARADLDVQWAAVPVVKRRVVDRAGGEDEDQVPLGEERDRIARP